MLKSVTVVVVNKFFQGHGLPDAGWKKVATFVVDGHLSQHDKDEVEKAVLKKYPLQKHHYQGENFSFKTTSVEFMFTTSLGDPDPWMIGEFLNAWSSSKEKVETEPPTP